MLHKTENSIDTLSVTTKPQTSKAASFTVPSKRQMYRNKALSNSKKVQTQISNMVVLQPQFATFVIDDKVYFIDSSQSSVTITDFHYCLRNDRAKPVMIPRNCQPGAQLLFANVKKPGVNICFQSIHRFSSLDYPIMIHINVTKYNPAEFNSIEAKDIYLQYDNTFIPTAFMTVENGKRGLFISQLTNKKGKQKQYQIMYINLLKNNKIKNLKHSSMIKQSSFSLNSTSSEQIPDQQSKSQKQYLFSTPDSILQNINFQPNEHFVKLINSQYGDAILLATNLQIYQLQFQGKLINLKKIDLKVKLKKYFKINAQQIDQDQLVDFSYIVDGLKIIFQTKNGIIGWIQAQNITYAKSIYQIIANSHKKQQHKQKIKFKQLFMMVDKIALLTQNNSVCLFKMRQNQITYQKKVDLPVVNNDTISYKINVLSRHDELILQRISKNNNTNFYSKFQVLSKNLISSSNQFNKLFSSNILQNPQKSVSPLKIVTSKANSISCTLKQNTITFYKINQSESQNSVIQLLFSKNFFEKPIYVSIDPYASNVIIHFKQFVKFYKFHYHDINQYYTYNVRGVAYAAYSDSGQYIIIAVDDLLYFLNAFTFQTQRIMEMYGDIKSIRFYDDMLYVLSKPKIAKNNMQTLTLQIFTFHRTQFFKIYQTKLQPSQALYTDHNFCIISSNSNIQVYTKKIQQYDDQMLKKNSITSLIHKQSKLTQQCQSKMQMINKRKIKLIDVHQYPTCITLCEEFGVIFIGTNAGRVYQYIWPFVEQEQLEYYYCLQCSLSEISKIQISPTYQTMQIYSKSTSILHCKFIQYVQGQQMPNVYIISPKTLYSAQSLKYHLANRQYLYPASSSYIFQDMRQSNENIQQLKFILQKIKDDIEEYVNKENDKIKDQVQKFNKRKVGQYGILNKQKIATQTKNQLQIKQLAEQLELLRENHKNLSKKEKDQYEKSLLDLYKEASRLRGIINQLQNQHRRQKDIYLIENEKIMKTLRQEGEKMQLQYKNKFAEINKNSSIFQSIQNQQAFKRIDQQLIQYKQSIRIAIDLQLQTEEQRKQSFLGSNGYLQKEIANYIRRRDQFQALIMQTHMQIDELYSDEGAYAQKVKYLMNQLNKKEKMIEQKQKELVKLIDNSVTMKKLKQTHQFQLQQYEKQFEPILTKINVIQQQVQKMNGEILREYLNKVDKDKQVIQNKRNFQKLKKLKQKKIKIKLDTHTKLQRFLAQLQILLQKPFDQQLRSNLNILSLGQKFVIDQQQVKQKILNSKIMRRKQFIGKQIQQHEKRQQQVLRNQNQINRHYNQNTMLVRQFNNLKQQGRKFQQKQIEIKLIAAKATRLQTPKRKTNSVIQLKKYSQQKITPFQKHELQFNQMFNKGITTETKLGNSGKSMSLLKTLIRDVQGTDSKYEKMQIIRQRIKSFVNPQIRIRKTLATQRVLFDRKKAESEYQK